MDRLLPKVKREVRRRRYISAWIAVDGMADRECRVADVSQHGAKITIDDAAVVGSRLAITLAPHAPKRECEVIWRRGKTLGIKFVP